MKAAAIQMTSRRDVDANLAEADRLLAGAAEQGAELAVLPENFSFLGAADAERQAVAEAAGHGPAQEFLAAAAARYGLWLVGGTVPIRGDGDRCHSRSLLFDPTGAAVAHYDKIHLFDVDVPGNDAESYRESATTLSGTRVVTHETPLGRIGMSVCYDLRFPALFHRLGMLGMDILVLPAAFTVPTGQVHWLALLQARAIESLTYVVASGQWGEHAGGRKTYGHSMVIGPWGQVLDCLDAGAGAAMADLDMIGLQELRQKFPSLAHRRDL
jgi:deaminated glutathione amidase